MQNSEESQPDLRQIRQRCGHEPWQDRRDSPLKTVAQKGSFIRDLSIAGTVVLGIAAVIVLWTFPYATDDPIRREDVLAEFYAKAYDPTARASIFKPTASAPLAQAERVGQQIREEIASFVATHHLTQARVLDVGSGPGSLQDVVADYTGIDIASTVAPQYHKHFVVGTATAMPFPDHSFDVVWSIWVLEHIPNPEAALREMRRVVKPGGYLYLKPAWNVAHWASRGLSVRPYADLGWRDRIEKTSIPLRRSYVGWWLSQGPMRMFRVISTRGPSTLHYRRLTPNYSEYWEPDSDAVNDLDSLEVARWFESRGDTCLNCPRGFARYFANAILELEVRRGSD